MAPEGIRNLGIQGIDHIDFVVHDLERSTRFYTQKMDFAETARSNARSEEATGEKTAVFDAARVRVQCSAPARKDSDAARFLRNHPDGVRAVVFRVADLQHAWKTLEARGANFMDEPTGPAGHRQFAIASPLGDVEYRFLENAEGAVDPRLSAVVPGAAPTGRNRHQFTHMDHVTSNTKEMRSLTNWYRDVLGMEHFWDIRFHTKDSKPDMEGGSGLNSIVMWDPTCNVKFATNEPLRPNYHASQIAKYVDDNKGPGVQHIAFSTKAIMDVIPQMNAAGLKFLDTPDAYYKMLPSRLAERAVTNLKEDIEELRRRRILVDGRADRYLLQIFMQEAALLYNEAEAGPFFYEVIQRHGDQGFGEGNFRALFESIERQQTKETPAGVRTVQNPYLRD
ncbi:MAG: 4-hydroxyphenylpyruvate dioxygenase [Thermoplasmata archaeon]|jgi:4-hydroxyphenylpyruvate dioxygenase|nr:4-hydroxyphenylpyruvate dioxygenase [Thermoplasmata archaeon]